MFSEAAQTRRQCFLAMFPKGGQTRTYCFLAMFPEGEQTMRHCVSATKIKLEKQNMFFTLLGEHFWFQGSKLTMFLSLPRRNVFLSFIAFYLLHVDRNNLPYLRVFYILLFVVVQY